MAKAKAKPTKPASAKAPKAKGKSSRKGGSGGTMFKFLFLCAIIGAGYAAYTVPYQGQTFFERGIHYVEHEMDEHHRAASHETPAPTVERKHPEATVADRRPVRPHAPAEHITQSDKDALDKLLPR